MVQKTRGIVFRFTKYGDTSIIVNIFTETYGLQSYIVNGIRSHSTKNRMALYQPLTLLDLVVYHRENANINRIKEARCYHLYRTIPVDVRKSACAIFANEVINKTIREEGSAQELYEFLEETFIQLDDLTSGVEYFPLIFLVRLSYFLGFGATTYDVVLGTRVISGEDEVKLRELLEANYGGSLTLSTGQRRELLDVMLRFYADHMEWLGEWKSITVLREVLT